MDPLEIVSSGQERSEYDDFTFNLATFIKIGPKQGHLHDELMSALMQHPGECKIHPTAAKFYLIGKCAPMSCVAAMKDSFSCGADYRSPTCILLPTLRHNFETHPRPQTSSLHPYLHIFSSKGHLFSADKVSAV